MSIPPQHFPPRRSTRPHSLPAIPESPDYRLRRTPPQPARPERPYPEAAPSSPPAHPNHQRYQPNSPRPTPHQRRPAPPQPNQAPPRAQHYPPKKPPAPPPDLTLRSQTRCSSPAEANSAPTPPSTPPKDLARTPLPTSRPAEPQQPPTCYRSANLPDQPSAHPENHQSPTPTDHRPIPNFRDLRPTTVSSSHHPQMTACLGNHRATARGSPLSGDWPAPGKGPVASAVGSGAAGRSVIASVPNPVIGTFAVCLASSCRATDSVGVRRVAIGPCLIGITFVT